MTSKITIDEINAFLGKFYEQIPNLKVTELEHGRAVLQLRLDERDIRPGGMAHGPIQMMIADVATYIATFTITGINLMAVTTNLNMNFLRPLFGEVIEAEAKILRVGSSLSTATVEVRAAGADPKDNASHAVVTFALPSQDKKA